MKASKGFTLLELMIAIFIFAMVSMAAYRLLDSATQIQRVADDLLGASDKLAQTQAIIEADMLQIAPRPIRTEFGDTELAICTPYKNGFLIEFTRYGWKNTLSRNRSDLQRVAYGFEQGVLERYYWTELDRAPEPRRIKQSILKDIRSIRFQFLDQENKWHSYWPPVQPSQRYAINKNTEKSNIIIPKSIHISIEHEFYGRMDYRIPQADSDNNEDENKIKYEDQLNKKKQSVQNKGSLFFKNQEGDY
ncbi:MAG: type II secretion system minor pseudopilin GspJ [Endozoicomonas sp. (ex Botrylloides leachii)]|nr:type II secretion system minor pseudopilin GspJ [Endozoicomonas sp. (ex Botrylloides leachii)]